MNTPETLGAQEDRVSIMDEVRETKMVMYTVR